MDATLAQGVPALDWTPQERQFVEEMRAVYLKQGSDLTTQQAEAAVKQFRDRQQPAQKGVPQAEWSAQEQELIARTRAAYGKKGMTFTDEQASMAVQAQREQIAKLTGKIGAMQALAS